MGTCTDCGHPLGYDREAGQRAPRVEAPGRYILCSPCDKARTDAYAARLRRHLAAACREPGCRDDSYRRHAP